MLLEPGIAYIAAFLGCLYAGITAVPAYPPSRPRHLPRLQAIIADAQVKFVLTSQMVAQGMPLKINSLVVEKIFKSTKYTFQPVLLQKEDIAFLQYTSGSTGQPKGVMVSHSNLVTNLEILKHLFANDGGNTKICSWLPPYHDMGLIGSILYPIFVGAPVYLMPPLLFIKKPILWLKLISDERITTSCAPNFAYDLCVATVTPKEIAKLDLSCWKITLNGAEPIRSHTLERFARTFGKAGYKPNTMCPAYGMAETTLILSGKKALGPNKQIKLDKLALEQGKFKEADNKNQDVSELISCGPPVPEHEVLIVHPEDKTVCAESIIGEIWARGPCITKGYWNKPQLNEEFYCAKLANNPDINYFRTGDLGCFDQEGNLYITGRMKDLIIIRGRNLHPHDLEETVSASHPALIYRQCAVFTLREKDDDRLVAVQEVLPTQQNFSEIYKKIQKAVFEEHELTLHKIVLIQPRSLPKTSSGKIQRSRCRSMLYTNKLKEIDRKEMDSEKISVPKTKMAVDEVSSIKQPNSVEEIKNYLALYVGRQRGIATENVIHDRPFSEFGFDSLKSTRFCDEISKQLGIELNPVVLWEYPNIKELAQYLAAQLGLDTVQAEKTDSQYNKNSDYEEIAIVGMACHFPPDLKTPQKFWDLLLSGQNAIREVPKNRWNIDAYYDTVPGKPGKMISRHGGFLEGIDLFDAHFFNITPGEAQTMDPQQRLLLEVSWEALENAGQNVYDLKESLSGVFIGADSNDYGYLISKYGKPEQLNPYTGTGNALSAMAGRLSYFLNWQGPATSISTACSSSLVALHQACISLQRFECHMALAGGVNLILNPDATISMSSANMLAPDGRCKTFDASADGYVRSEGCGMVVLKRLTDAQKDGDEILAVIKSSTVNQNGASNGLTAPNGKAQAALFKQTLTKAGLKATDIDYVEAHGTGTALGDPIEVQSIQKVYGHKRSKEQPLVIGSVKTNIGHLESAAGIAGLIKTVLALKNQKIPKNLHLKEVNPLIDLEKSPTIVPTEHQNWSKSEKKIRYAGINSFGFTGTNAHVILQEVPPDTEKDTEKIEPEEKSQPRPLHLLPLSAKNNTALTTLAQKYQDHITQSPAQSIEEITYTASTGRSHLDHRLVVLAKNTKELGKNLRDKNYLTETILSKGKRPKIAFLFSGQGSQYFAMGQQLYKSQPVFRKVFKRCSTLFEKYLKIPLEQLLYDDKYSSSDLLNQTAYTQPALFTIEYALAKLWQSWGVVPDYVMGHSLGECVAAVVAGVCSLEDGINLVAARATLMQALPEGGGMVAVMWDLQSVKEVVQEIKTIDIATINDPEQVVISGKLSDLKTCVHKFEKDGIKTQWLKVSHGFHSQLMEPMLNDFRETIQPLVFNTPEVRLISNVTGKILDSADADYWVDHVREPVNFLKGMQRLSQEGCGIFIEIGPQPVLIGMGRRCMTIRQSDKNTFKNTLWLPSLRNNTDDWQQILDSLGHLYVENLPVDWKGFYQPYATKKVTLPNYSFQRKRHWLKELEQFGQSPAETSKSLIEPAKPGNKKVSLKEETRVDPDSSVATTTVRNRVLEAVGHLCGLSTQEILPEAAFSDIGISSINLFELWHDLLTTYPKLEVCQNELSRMRTVQEVIDFVKAKLAPESTSTGNIVATPKSLFEDWESKNSDFYPGINQQDDSNLLKEINFDQKLKGLCAPLQIDTKNTFFFDHPYDHIPGVLFLESINQLIKTALFSKESKKIIWIQSIKLSFEQWGNLNSDIRVTLDSIDSIFPETNGYQISGKIVENKKSTKTVCVKYQARCQIVTNFKTNKSRPEIPVTRDRSNVANSEIVHKNRSENILISNLTSGKNQDLYCSSVLPSQNHRYYKIKNPFYTVTHLFEAARQMSTAIAHQKNGEQLDRTFILLSLQINLKQPIPYNAELELSGTLPKAAQIGHMKVGRQKISLIVQGETAGEVVILGNTVDKESYQRLRFGL